MEDVVKLKRARFKTYRKLVKPGQTGEAKAAKEAYNDAKRLAKRTVWQATAKAEEDTFANISPNDSSIFKVAKQMDKTNQVVVGEKCVRNDAGELSLSHADKMKAWVEHYLRLLNMEFEWPSDLLPEVPPVEGPPSPVTVTHIRKALGKMKQGKAAGPSGVISEMLKAAGEKGLEKLRLLAKWYLAVARYQRIGRKAIYLTSTKVKVKP